MSKSKLAILVVFLILLFDQFIKIWIKTHFIYGEEVPVFGNWFILHFTENNGMAFGMEFGGSIGKIALTLFRIIAVFGIIWYLNSLIKQKAANGLIISIALILSGALGNILDSAFYGVLFSDSYGRIAEFLPESGGYASFLHGKVVDMLYFPIIKGFIPDWSPIWKNEYFIFFRPIFNIADSAITTGVAMILVFQKRYFKDIK